MPLWFTLAMRVKQLLIVVEKYIAASSLLLLLLLMLVQIIARNFFDTGFLFNETLSRLLVPYIALMGAALASEDNNHIKIDILCVFLNSKQKARLIRPLLFISAVISGLFGWYATQFWLDEWTYAPANEQWSVLLALILPFGFMTVSLHLLLLAITGFTSPAATRVAP